MPSVEAPGFMRGRVFKPCKMSTTNIRALARARETAEGCLVSYSPRARCSFKIHLSITTTTPASRPFFAAA